MPGRNGQVDEPQRGGREQAGIRIRHAGRVVTRKMLCEHLWDTDWEGSTNVIEVHIKRLRDKLTAAGEPSLIRTVRGRGYAVRAT